MKQYSSVLPLTRHEWRGYPDGWVGEKLPQTNPTNPILSAYRRYSRNRVAGYWVHRLQAGTLPADVDSATVEEAEHARAVLTRLARFEAES